MKKAKSTGFAFFCAKEDYEYLLLVLWKYFYGACTSSMSDKSPHILNAASNLLGICFVVLTTLKALRVDYVRKIDELTAVTMFLLMIAIVFSFLSIRNGRPVWERMADISFVIAILCLFAVTLIVTFDMF